MIQSKLSARELIDESPAWIDYRDSSLTGV